MGRKELAGANFLSNPPLQPREQAVNVWEVSTGTRSVMTIHSAEGSLLIHLNFMTPDLTRLPFLPRNKKKDQGCVGPEGETHPTAHLYADLYICMHSLVMNCE